MVDGLQKPWCYYGPGDNDWDYCDESCENSLQPDSSSPLGVSQDELREMKFSGLQKLAAKHGIDEDAVDAAMEAEKPKEALIKLLMQTAPKAPEDAGTACTTTVTGKTCDKWGENDFGLDPASNTCEQVDGLDKPWCYTSGEEWDYCNCKSKAAKKKKSPPRAVEPGCDSDREENQALRERVKEFKRNKRSMEMQSKWSFAELCLGLSAVTAVNDVGLCVLMCSVVELRKKLAELGHDA